MSSGSRKSVGGRSIMRLVAMLMFAASVFVVTGCGNGVTGTYVAEDKATEDSGMKFTLELKSGGVAVLTIGGPDDQAAPPVTGTYTVEGDKIITMLDNDRDELILKDGKLAMDFFGEKLVLTKK